MDDKERRIKEKMEFFLEEKVPVHISTKDKFFYNGSLTKKKSDNVYILDDVRKGVMLIFISDIFKVSEMRGEYK